MTRLIAGFQIKLCREAVHGGAGKSPGARSKSTQIRILKEYLERCGRQVVATREPGGCPIDDAIRAILLDPANRALVTRTELLLYAAARAQHVEQVIRPALADGAMVLCDRFVDATTPTRGAAAASVPGWSRS